MCNPKYRNKGYTTKMIKYILNLLPFETIIANIDSKNIPSQRVAEKCGFIKDPIRRFHSDRIIYKYVYTK
jgi:RimJ/RimL family protein N-acetyltransferase